MIKIIAGGYIEMDNKKSHGTFFSSCNTVFRPWPQHTIPVDEQSRVSSRYFYSGPLEITSITFKRLT